MTDVKPPVGPITPGNLNLMLRPRVPNNGGISSVLSGSYNFDGRETLIPHVDFDHDRPLTPKEAIALYRRLGLHLGQFGTPRAATNAGDYIHRDQERMGYGR